MNDAAQGVVEDVPQDVAQDLGSGPGRRAPSSPRHNRRLPPCLCAVRAEMGAQLGSSVAFGSGCRQTLPGVPRKAHTSPFDTDLTRNTRAPHFTPQHWLLCHMGLY